MKRGGCVLWISLVVLMGLACGHREEIEEFKAQWIKLKHKPIEEAKVGSEAPINAEIEVSQGISDVRLFIYYTAGTDPQEVVRMEILEPNKYFGSVPSQDRGTLVEYYIEARAGHDLAVRVPREEKQAGFSFYYKGIPNRPLLIIHIILMFVSLFVFLFSGYLAFKALRSRLVVLEIPRLVFMGAVLFFVSSFPLGMVVAYQTYGRPWTGFPVGNDITDNKSLAIILYWAAATFLYRGSVFKKDPARDLIGMKTLPYVYLVGVVLTAVLFAIPH
jgi:hypothetical protein